jgi:Flp pilus assembly protein TadG
MPKLRFANFLTARIFHLARDRKANVAVIFALVMVPTIYLLGMAMDYTQALRKQSQLNAATDAAAIAATRPAMLAQPDSVAQAAATAIFSSTAKNLPGLTSIPTPTIVINDAGLQRTVTVSYNAKAINNFPILLGSPAWPIQGSSTAQASNAPNLNFYLLMDVSPSMAIGATDTDIANLITYTKNQPAPSANCGFACHETTPSKDTTPPNSSNVDNLTIAHNKGVTLRIDLVVSALQQLLVAWNACPQKSITSGAMQCMAALNNTTYKAGIYTFDINLNTIQSLTTPAVAGTYANGNNIQLFTVDHQNCVTLSNCNTDYGTAIETALTGINNIMPNPGLGSNTPGDTPGEVVFLVTDGVDDMLVSSKTACNPNATYPLQASGTKYRCQQPIDPTICTTIKNRGIRIAVLYTEYLQLTNPPLPVTDSWYASQIAQFDNPTSKTGQIAQNLQACASSPDLFADVQTGGDVSGALTQLFIKVASSTASLTH